MGTGYTSLNVGVGGNATGINRFIKIERVISLKHKNGIGFRLAFETRKAKNANSKVIQPDQPK